MAWSKPNRAVLSSRPRDRCACCTILMNKRQRSNPETLAAAAAILFVGVDKLKSFVEASSLIVYDHAIQINQMFGVNIYPDTIGIEVSCADLGTLFLIHVF